MSRNHPLDPAKVEAQKQWDRDPCGASTVTDEIPGTLPFYRKVRHYRYMVYAPWFDRVANFASHHDLEVLEIGSGLGSDHYRFAAQRNHMTALDLSMTHLKHTRRHLELEGLVTAPVYGDAEDMPFAAEAFDLVYAFGVLHHTPSTQAAIAEIYRVLKPGGTAIIGVYHRNSWFFWTYVILIQGVLRRKLFAKGLPKILSEIEYRENSNSAQPLVKVYTRRQFRKLLRGFSHFQIDVCHVEAEHFFPGLRRIIQDLTRRAWLERYLNFGGWFLVAKARKGM